MATVDGEELFWRGGDDKEGEAYKGRGVQGKDRNRAT